jgi:hypothetical protein
MRIKVYLRDEDWTGNRTVYVIEEMNGGELYSLSPNGDGTLVRSRLQENSAERPKPFLSVPAHLAPTLLPALVEGLAQGGFDRPSESTLRGENGAIKAHLSDLRQMLKLK